MYIIGQLLLSDTDSCPIMLPIPVEHRHTSTVYATLPTATTESMAFLFWNLQTHLSVLKAKCNTWIHLFLSLSIHDPTNLYFFLSQNNFHTWQKMFWFVKLTNKRLMKLTKIHWCWSRLQTFEEFVSHLQIC